LRRVPAAERASKDIESRLVALSRAHDVLTRENWEGASLREIVAQAIEPYRRSDAGRFKTEGPDIRLAPRTALALAMAFHELGTNAAKYGALSNESGRVEIKWSVSEDTEAPHLRLRWTEKGGPPVGKPAHRGFGSRLIERSLALDLGGEASLRFDPAGVVWTVAAPIEPN
jgi:two-component sensor histidine kinase